MSAGRVRRRLTLTIIKALPGRLTCAFVFVCSTTRAQTQIHRSNSLPSRDLTTWKHKAAILKYPSLTLLSFLCPKHHDFGVVKCCIAAHSFETFPTTIRCHYKSWTALTCYNVTCYNPVEMHHIAQCPLPANFDAHKSKGMYRSTEGFNAFVFTRERRAAVRLWMADRSLRGYRINSTHCFFFHAWNNGARQ